MHELTPEDVPELLRAFEASDWTTMTLRADRVTFAVARDGAPPAHGAAPAPDAEHAGPGEPVPAAAPAPGAAPTADAAPAPSREGLVAVRAPVMGAFYRAPQPGAPPYVEVGQAVGPDDTVAIVEVMKLMNQVAAGAAGEVAEVCASDGEMVQEGQELFLLRPAGDTS